MVARVLGTSCQVGTAGGLGCAWWQLLHTACIQENVSPWSGAVGSGHLRALKAGVMVGSALGASAATSHCCQTPEGSSSDRSADLSLFPRHSLKGVFLGCRGGCGKLRKPGKSQGEQQDGGTCVRFRQTGALHGGLGKAKAGRPLQRQEGEAVGTWSEEEVLQSREDVCCTAQPWISHGAWAAPAVSCSCSLRVGQSASRIARGRKQLFSLTHGDWAFTSK